ALQVPIAFRVIAGGAAFPEPRMPIGSVVRHEVEKQLQPPPVCGIEKLVEIRERSEASIDLGVIGNVVTEIRHRRTENRRDPNGADPEVHEVVEAPRNPAEIADAIAVAVLKRARIDLIDRRRVPPFSSIRCKLVHCQSSARTGARGRYSTHWRPPSLSRANAARRPLIRPRRRASELSHRIRINLCGKLKR